MEMKAFSDVALFVISCLAPHSILCSCQRYLKTAKTFKQEAHINFLKGKHIGAQNEVGIKHIKKKKASHEALSFPALTYKRSLISNGIPRFLRICFKFLKKR